MEQMICVDVLALGNHVVQSNSCLPLIQIQTPSSNCVFFQHRPDGSMVASDLSPLVTGNCHSTHHQGPSLFWQLLVGFTTGGTFGCPVCLQALAPPMEWPHLRVDFPRCLNALTEWALVATQWCAQSGNISIRNWKLAPVPATRTKLLTSTT